MIFYKKRFSVSCFVIAFLVSFFSNNQESALAQGFSPDSLKEKLSLYAKINASGLLYVHTDKTLYSNNETIWFAGYLINGGLGGLEKHTIISVSLMREDDRRIICEQQNVIKNGLGTGSLIIPDNAPPGNYRFNAYTNVLDQHGKPLAIFSQPVTIKNIKQRKFSAELTLLDTDVVNGMVRAGVIVSIKDEKRKANPIITYGIGGKMQKISLSDKENSASISIPAAQLNSPDPILVTQVAYNYDTLYMSLKLPKLQAKGLYVRFFPEGGDLVDGLESTVAVETTTTEGLQVSLTGILFANNNPVDTISTNSYGIGRFNLKPDKNNIYTFKIKANVYLNKDTIYKLPNITEDGIIMRFKSAIVTDTLQMSLYSKVRRKVQVLVHNYREKFSFFNTEAYPEGKKFSLIIPTLPKGIATVTILSEEGKPMAERLFFAHYDQKIIATIKTDKPIYNKRDSVTVTIILKDEKGHPVEGLLSVAAVQENRIEVAKQQDIESYVYLNYELGALPKHPQGSKPYLEDMFLTKGWRRFTWKGLMHAQATDTLSIGRDPEFKGNVLYYKKPLKKPIDILLIRWLSDINEIVTANNGAFVLSAEQLTIREGHKVQLRVGKLDSDGYSIKFDNPFSPINRNIAENADIIKQGFSYSETIKSDQQLKIPQGNIMLDAVNIKGNKRNDLFFGYKGPPTNSCGDYVCKYGILNCPVDPPFRAPVKGERLGCLSLDGRQIGSVTYERCTTAEQEISGIYSGREFYGLNRDPNALLDPQYLSTLFWKSEIVTNPKGEMVFSFFTSDVTGKFRILIQGISNNDVLFGESEFSVKN